MAQGNPKSSGVEAEVVEFPGAIVLRLVGELRLDLAPVERQLIRLSAARPALVVIDLAGLSFISSLGMGLLNHFRRGLDSHGGVTKIAAAHPDVDNALWLCNFDKLFEFHDSVENALAVAPANTPPP